MEDHNARQFSGALFATVLTMRNPKKRWKKTGKTDRKDHFPLDNYSRIGDNYNIGKRTPPTPRQNQ